MLDKCHDSLTDYTTRFSFLTKAINSVDRTLINRVLLDEAQKHNVKLEFGVGVERIDFERNVVYLTG